MIDFHGTFVRSLISIGELTRKLLCFAFTERKREAGIINYLFFANVFIRHLHWEYRIMQHDRFILPFLVPAYSRRFLTRRHKSRGRIDDLISVVSYRVYLITVRDTTAISAATHGKIDIDG